MIYRFGGCSLDTDKHQLTFEGAPVAIEPQVFALLRLLIEARERLVTRDEIIDKIWNGRIVSEAAVSSRIKSARQAIGDDGAAQRLIRTLPKLGFRFVGEVAETVEPAAAPPRAETPEPVSSRPSIAVLPFEVIGAGVGAAGLADGLPHDLIAELSRLRWLFVIARGSSFRFRPPDVDLAQVRQALGVGYCLTGSVEIGGGGMSLAVELCDARDGRAVWGERFKGPAGAVHEIREEIVRAVIAALELQIPLLEAQRARLQAPGSLDAWSAFHLGLGHLFRFTPQANAQAGQLFRRALEIDPGFARAHAGLSFVHFENAFLSFTDDASAAAELARRSAETALEHDPLDPFCNLVMGRAFWLRQDLEASLPWLDRAIELSPNYAQAVYSRAWSESLLGQGAQAQAGADAALALSPLDPLAYGMRGVRAFSHLVRDEPAAAAEWAERAARSPGAHALIEMTAAVSHQLAGDRAKALAWASAARRRHPGLGEDAYFEAFPFRHPAARSRIAQALQTFGDA
ncbi:MAG: winged helix-turn-helix domain-containing protein [Phenylobacterium sp.]